MLARVLLTGPDVVALLDRQHEHPSVADFPGPRRADDGLDDLFHHVVGDDHVVEDVIQAIIRAARTGEIGDGRVFVLPVEQSYNIRTGEQDAS